MKLDRDSFLKVYCLFRNDQKPAIWIYQQLIEIFGGGFGDRWESLFSPVIIKQKDMTGENEKYIFEFNSLSLVDIERKIIEKALELTRFVQKDAAKLLQISYRSLNYKIHYHQITHSSWKVNIP
jgi:DNA-binding NtrC family response regulator